MVLDVAHFREERLHVGLRHPAWQTLHVEVVGGWRVVTWRNEAAVETYRLYRVYN